MKNPINDMECDYGIYANYKGLPDAGRRCNKIATDNISLNGQIIPLCKEHYNKISSWTIILFYIVKTIFAFLITAITA